jgi:nucleoside-diphosphate-sugar epimerase
MRVLVLGGTGLTGPFAVRRLCALGNEVTVFHRGEHAADLPPAVRVVRGDFDRLPPELRRPAPDVVVHMWAMTEAAAQSFVAFFRGFAGRVVLISSGDVYRAYGRLQRIESGPPDQIPIDEQAPLRETLYPYRNMLKADSPEWMRNYDKILVERAVLTPRDLPATILRYPAVYGPGDSYHRFRAWLQQMETGGDIEVQDTYAQWRWTHGYVENVAEAVVLAATDPRAANRIYNVGEPETPSMAGRIEELGRMADWQGRVLPVPTEELPHDFAHHLVVDTTRIRQELDYAEPVTRETGLARTIAWERQPG